MMDKKPVKRFFSAPADGSFFLFGPRGTGKSTWLAMEYSDSLWIDFNDPETARLYSSKPERLRETVAASRYRVIVVDEVQRAPGILDVVHQLIERDKSLRFILTGSSSRKLKRAGIDLLAGRALLKTMPPFVAKELGNSFDLSDALEFGMVPLVYDSKDRYNTLRTYVALYIKEEVQAEGLVRNIGGFSRFVEAAAFSHGTVLNIANIARECQVERRVVSNYLEILSDLLLCFTVPVFSRRAKRAVTTHPKLYFFDAGVFRSIRPKGPFDRPGEIDGAGLEGLVAQHLKAWVSFRDHRDELYFWRTKAGSEVDFVLYGESGLFAFEVKNTNVARRADLRPLRTFLADYPMATGFFLYRGKQKLLIDGIRCLPCDELLSTIGPDTDFETILR
jgi:predicted AAA+ superfamily ATPase